MTGPSTHPAWCVEDRFEPGIGVGDSHLSAEIVLPQTRNTEMTVRLAQASDTSDHEDSTLDPQILIAGVSDREGVWLRLDMASAQDLLAALPKLILAVVHPELGARGLTAMANVTAVQLRDALPACGNDVDDAVAALAVVETVLARDECTQRVSATCTWSESPDPHLANYVTDAGATQAAKRGRTK